MKAHYRCPLVVTVLIFALLAANPPSALANDSDSDDWKAARRASCEELTDAYRTTAAAERKVVEEMKNTSRAETGTNQIGRASCRERVSVLV